MLTAFSSVESAVEAKKKVTFDYIAKPVGIEEVKIVVEQALSVRVLNEEMND